jgi:hypothetical protein
VADATCALSVATSAEAPLTPAAAPAIAASRSAGTGAADAAAYSACASLAAAVTCTDSPSRSKLSASVSVLRRVCMASMPPLAADLSPVAIASDEMDSSTATAAPATKHHLAHPLATQPKKWSHRFTGRATSRARCLGRRAHVVTYASRSTTPTTTPMVASATAPV